MALNLSGRKCVVVGGGKVATRKVAGLLDAGAEVLLVSPEATPELREMANAGKIDWRRRHFAHPDVEGALLVFASTNDEVVNDLVMLAARSKGILVNVASGPGGGDFLLPAVYRDGPVTVAVDTGGAAPALSAHLRDVAGKALPQRAGELAETLGRLKRALTAETWRETCEGGLAGAISSGNLERALKLAEKALEKVETLGETGRSG
jgi:precorrin-2 dehydrogenase/sirohydrochlorin ferrochelatase